MEAPLFNDSSLFSGLIPPDFQFEKLNTLRASVTSLLNNQEAGAILLYHGHTVSLLWQSQQARTASVPVAGASQTGSWTTARSASAFPMGRSRSTMRSATAANKPKMMIRLIVVGVCFHTTRRSHLNLMAPAWVSQRLVNQRSQQHATQLRGFRYSVSRASQEWGGRGSYRPSLDVYRGGSTYPPPLGTWCSTESLPGIWTETAALADFYRPIAALPYSFPYRSSSVFPGAAGCIIGATSLGTRLGLSLDCPTRSPP